MAEGALVGVAKGVTDKASNLLAQEIALLWGVKDEIKKLGDTVLTISAVIQDAEEKQQHNNQVRVWLERLNDALYEADDLLDDISTEAIRREVMTRNKKAKEVHIFFSKSNQLVYGLKMGHNVKAMRERLDAIKKDKGFHLDECPVETQVRNYRVRETHSFVPTEKVIGRDNDKEKIIRILLDTNVEESVLILPIVGLGGLGKTTLAQLVFNDKEIEKHFEQKLWVCISDNFDVKMIVEKILQSAKYDKLKKLEMDPLIKILKKEIDGKKYLLVLDDVWNENPGKWDSLKDLLMGGARGSRILVTTRSNRVAKITKTVQPYLLEGLDKEKSWSLFKRMAFENGQEPEKSIFKVVGKEILEKCKGVPLAIRTIGSLLYFKNTEKEWLSFKDSELSRVPQEENDILPTLRLSYDHLPSYLKQCFAYCCLFPKDYKIHKATLIQMWMAQGFIRPLNQNQCLEDVGHEYIMDLLWRSFFQEVEKDEWGNILQFKMHDLMHDLAKLVARSYSTTCNSKEEIIDEKTLHVSFGGQFRSQIPSSLVKASRIRTFMVQSQFGSLDESINNGTIVRFKFLRLLNLQGSILSIPSSIGELKHLRYLDLSNNNYIRMLPNSITRLHNLHTLKLYGCPLITKLPRDFTKLVNLKHFEIDALMHIPRGLVQMVGLQSLSKCQISMTSSLREWKDLHGLNELRNLTILNLSHGKDVVLKSKAANLKEKHQLQFLELWWKQRSKVNELSVGYDEQSLEAMQPHPKLQNLDLYNYGGVKFPNWMSSLTNLVKFSLEGCNKCQYLPSLEQFRSLEYLYLYKLDSLEYMLENDFSEELSNSSFIPSLYELKISFCPNLKGWWRQRRDSLEDVDDKNHLLPFFPGLCYLEIRRCPKLTSMPLFPNVQRLTLSTCSLKPLKQTSTLQITNSSFTPLSKLEHLVIGALKEPFPNLSNLVSLRCYGPLPQGMQHLTALEKIEIYGIEEVDLSNFGNAIECQGLKSLQSLEISCPKLKSLPEGMGDLSSLQTLKIDRCHKLTSLPEGMGGFTSLQIDRCHKKTSLPKGMGSLTNLWIDRCHKLTSLPEGMGGLTSLQTLRIDRCHKLTSLPEGIGGLTSLWMLTINKCHKLTSLPEGMGGLTSLRILTINKCHKLTSLPEGMGGLTSLQKLTIDRCHKLTSLPEGMGGLISLQKLTINRCHKLTSLPQRVGGLISLQILTIDRCHKLTSLPEGMSGLTSLNTLDIDGCPILLKRCKRETGKDWPKISHIPNLEGDLHQQQTN